MKGREVWTKPRWILGRIIAQAPILVAIALAFQFVGGKSCAKDAPSQSVGVLEVVPREVEVGDRVAIIGAGFPLGKPARVTFRGTLHRPGERPAPGAEIVVLATVLASERLELDFDEATQARFARAGDRATHTTFDGEVEVAFAALVAGGAPIAGVLEHVVLDVRPSTSAGLRDGEREGERALAWMGVRAVVGGSGLVVEEVRPGSRAEGAGIGTGDILTSFDGVRVASPADVVPAPGERIATIRVRSAREGTQPTIGTESTRMLPMAGFRRSPPADLVGAALIILGAIVVVWLFGAPTRPIVASALQRVASRLRERLSRTLSACGTSSARSTLACARSSAWTDRGATIDSRTLWRALSAVAREALPPFGPGALADLAACALLAAMPFGQYAIAARLDAGLLFVAAATMLAAVSFVMDRSTWRGALAAAHVAWQHVPPAAAVASVVVTTGSLRIQEIEGAQGGWPWDWLAFRSPAMLIALGLLLSCMRLEPSATLRPGQGLALRLEDAGNTIPLDAPWLEAACRAHRVIVAGLASVLFLGGWLLPGLGAAEQCATPGLEIAGVAWMLAKTWALVLAMAWIRWSLPPLRVGARARVTWLRLVTLSIGALVATAAWTWWSPSPAAQLLMSTSLVATVGLAASCLAHRLRHGLTSAVGDGHLSTFL